MIKGNATLLKVLAKLAQVDDVQQQHVLFHGPPGSGKRLIVNEYVTLLSAARGSRRSCHYVHGTLTKTKDYISQQQRSSSSTSASLDNTLDNLGLSRNSVLSHCKLNGRECIVYDVDHMSDEAQRALCSLTDVFPKLCLILTTSNLNQVVDQLYSRCTVLQVQVDVRDTSADDGKDEVRDLVYVYSEGNERQAQLMTTAIEQASASISTKTKKELMFALFSSMPFQELETLLGHILSGDHVDLFKEVKAKLVDRGLGYAEVLDTLCKMVTFSPSLQISPEQRTLWMEMLVEKVAKAPYVTNSVHIYDLFARLVHTLVPFISATETQQQDASEHKTHEVAATA